MKRQIFYTGLLVVLLLGRPVNAQDDITPLIDAGRKSVAAGDYQKALEQFQQVVQKIQAQLSASIEKFFPDAPGGWEAGEIDSQSWSGSTAEGTNSMTNITRRYTRSSDKARCNINMTNWPQMVQTFRQSLDTYKQMQQIMQNNPDMDLSFEERDGWTLMKIVQKDSKNVQINAVHDKLIISIELNRPEPDVADQFVRALDLAGISKAVK